MIDFRYHLVSIASVFLALAIGIVLGAGPLQGTIGDTLANEVAQLRADADTMRSSLTTAESEIAAQEEVIAALVPRSAAGLIQGSTISVLALAGADEDAAEAATESLALAGADLGAAVTVTDAWTSGEPPDVTARTTAAGQVRELLVNDLPVGLDAERVLAVGLGWALGTDPSIPTDGVDEGAQPTDAPSPEDDSEGAVVDPGAAAPDPAVLEDAAADEKSEQILEILMSNGLLTRQNERATGRADLVLILTPDSEAEAAGGSAALVDLVSAMEESAAVVVAGDVDVDAETESGLVADIRASSDLRDRVSTLDNLGSVSGAAALPFVIAEHTAGVSDHYGLLSSASQLFPPVPTASTS